MITPTEPERVHAAALLADHHAADAMPLLDRLLSSMSHDNGETATTDTDLLVSGFAAPIIGRHVTALYLLGLLSGRKRIGRNAPFVRFRGPELHRWCPIRSGDDVPDPDEWRTTSERLYVRQVLHEYAAARAIPVADRILNVATGWGSTTVVDYDLARDLGIPTGSVRSHLRDLEALGLIEHDRDLLGRRSQFRRGPRLYVWCPLHATDGLLDVPDTAAVWLPRDPDMVAERDHAEAVLAAENEPEAMTTLRVILDEMDDNGETAHDLAAIREAAGHVLIHTTARHLRDLYAAGLLETWRTADGRTVIRRGPKLVRWCPRRGVLS